LHLGGAHRLTAELPTCNAKGSAGAARTGIGPKRAIVVIAKRQRN
jgi:hypothetical protein